MKPSCFSLKSFVALTIVLAFAATDAQSGPDLSVEALRFFSGDWPYYRGDVSRWEYRVWNIGDQAADSYTVGLYLSTDTTITTSDYQIAEASDGPVGTYGHGHDVGLITCRLPDDIPLGRYYIGIVLSCSNDTDLGNNSGYYSARTVSIVARPPDLVVQRTYSPPYLWRAAYKPGDEIDVEVVVENTGIGQANDYVLDYYASTDTGLRLPIST